MKVSVKVRLFASMRDHAGVKVADVQGKNVGEALDSLVNAYPLLKPQIFNRGWRYFAPYFSRNLYYNIIIMIIIRLLLPEDRVQMNIETDYYIFAEPFIVFLYLIFIFLSIQIWFIWKDIDRNELKIKSFFTDSFFKKNCIYVYIFSVFFIIHGFFDKTTTPVEYLELLGVLTLTSLVVFTYDWYSLLRTCVSKKSLPKELIDLRCIFKKN